MKCKLFFIAVIQILVLSVATAQEALKYQLPPAEIVKIVDAPQIPLVSVSPDKTSIVLVERPGIITIKELSAEEYRIAGLRINPATSGPSRQTFNLGFKIMNIDGTNIREIGGMPQDCRLSVPSWSADGKKFAFLNTKQSSIELWVCDVETLKASKVADDINMVFGNSFNGFGSAFNWLSDNKSIVYCVRPSENAVKPERSLTPEGRLFRRTLGKKGRFLPTRTFSRTLRMKIFLNILQNLR